MPKWIGTQNIENQITTKPKNPSILTQKDRTNVELIRKNYKLIEDYVTIPKELKLKKCHFKNRKSK